MNNKEFRLSDSDRNDAMNQLARAVGEGRLSVEEFEERSDNVMSATYGRDLVPVLKDIPSVRNTEIKEFSRADIERLRKDGQKTRLGVALITSLAGIAAGPFLIVASGASVAGIGLGLLALLAVPTIWILLYVMKIGPESWNTPSLRQLERERKRELGSKRQEQLGQLTDDALGIAQRQLSRWNKK